jgi:hypothetical protein
MTLTTVISAIATVISAIALVFSIYNFIVQRRDKKPMLKIDEIRVFMAIIGFGGSPSVDSQSKNVPIVSMRMRNTREKRVPVAQISLCTSRYFIHHHRTSLTSIIEQGQDFTYEYRKDKTIESGRKANMTFIIPDNIPPKYRRAYIEIEDELGNRYRSNGFILHMDRLKATA